MKNLLVALLVLIGVSTTAEAKILNLKANAFALLSGNTDFSLHLGLTNKFAIGGAYSSASSGGASYTAIEYIIDYHFNSFSSDGWYLEAFYSTFDSEGKVTVNTTTTTTTSSATKIGAFFGYQWMWSYINNTLGIGYGQITLDSSDAVFSGISGGYPVIIWRLGVAF